MLKIKDYVDMEKLKDFGFKPKYDENTGKIIAYEKKNIEKLYMGLMIVSVEVKSFIRIFKGNKNQWKINPYNDKFDIDTLYDLIQAGLVEKVVE